MTSLFSTAMNYLPTWNGATSLKTPDISGQSSGRLSLFFKSVRGLDEDRLYEYLQESALEDINDTITLAYHIRDCRQGKGERDLGINALCWLYLHYPEKMVKVLGFIPEYGRWEDLLHFFPRVILTKHDDISCNAVKYFDNVFSIISDQLQSDMNAMSEGKPISLLAKWLPSEGDSMDKEYKLVECICQKLSINKKQYRKDYIVPLRSYLKIVENYMCNNKWEEIDFNKVPSCAMKRLKKAFEKHTPELFILWKNALKTGQTKVNAKQLFPHELVKEIRTKNEADEVCEAQWKVLEDEVKKLGSLKDTICLIDTSSSMHSPDYLPLDVAVSLGLIISNATEGEFHNHVITFHEKPTFELIKDDTLYNRWNRLKNIKWGGSTNLQSVFDLIINRATACKIPAGNMPKRLIIISDMQFNNIEGYSSGLTNFEYMKWKYTQSIDPDGNSYKFPQIVFWNVNGGSEDFPVSKDDNGTVLISGFSPMIMKAILDGDEVSPYTVMRKTLDSDRYEDLKKILE